MSLEHHKYAPCNIIQIQFVDVLQQMLKASLVQHAAERYRLQHVSVVNEIFQSFIVLPPLEA
jgi:hypothetical protein